jgi:hypothetical protein
MRSYRYGNLKLTLHTEVTTKEGPLYKYCRLSGPAEMLASLNESVRKGRYFVKKGRIPPARIESSVSTCGSFSNTFWFFGESDFRKFKASQGTMECHVRFRGGGYSYEDVFDCLVEAGVLARDDLLGVLQAEEETELNLEF